MKYFNVPIAMLDGFCDRPRQRLCDMLAWATYATVKRIRAKDGNEYGYKVIKKAMEEMGYKHNGNEFDYYNVCGEIYSRTKGATAGITAENFFKMYNATEKATETEKVYFLASLALRSILGKKTYCKTNYKMMFARMNGRQKAYDTDEELKEQSHPTLTKHYTRRKVMTIRRALSERYGVATYSIQGERGFYISDKMTLEELIKTVESGGRLKPKSARDYAKEIRVIRDKVRAEIKAQETDRKPP